MGRTTTVFLYAGAIVLGWRILRYFYAGRLALNDRQAEQAAVRNRKAYRRAIGRWENEGGATLTDQNDHASRTQNGR